MEVLKLRMLLVVDNWKNAILGRSADEPSTATAAASGQDDDEKKSRPVTPECFLPDPVNDQLGIHISAVLLKEHNVYKLV